MGKIDLTPIVQAVIALLAALITYKLIPWIRSKTTETQQNNLTVAARIAVCAAEQLYGAGRGKEKLDYAIAALERAGYHLDDTLAREAIEKAVREIEASTRYLNATHDPAEPEEQGDADDSEFTDEDADSPVFDFPPEGIAEPIEELAEGAPGVTDEPPDGTDNG